MFPHWYPSLRCGSPKTRSGKQTTKSDKSLTYVLKWGSFTYGLGLQSDSGTLYSTFVLYVVNGRGWWISAADPVMGRINSQHERGGVSFTFLFVCFCFCFFGILLCILMQFSFLIFKTECRGLRRGSNLHQTASPSSASHLTLRRRRIWAHKKSLQIQGL